MDEDLRASVATAANSNQTTCRFSRVLLVRSEWQVCSFDINETFLTSLPHIFTGSCRHLQIGPTNQLGSRIA